MINISNIHYLKDHILLFSEKTPNKHKHFAKHLIYGVDGNLECAIGDKKVICRGICIESNVLHTVLTQNTKRIILLIDETSEIARSISYKFLKGQKYKIIDEEIVNQVSTYYYKCKDTEELDEKILSICDIQNFNQITYDDRVIKVIDEIDRTESIQKDIFDKLSNIAYLSQSRLSHLFREQVKISLASFLVMAKMHKTYNYYMRGENLTTASIHAGFDSSSHFSATCKKMFGLSFSDFKRD
ncbi:helix-turn-helix domain-containing protein [Vallitalea guaymasensis]|uniref:AraC family transcriptional regulator n=1 Tax=Vallitalea guaymasensis TaxID=1185412 RepID=A0A8J8MDE0_9FIRM|nr:helix-turn-helix domain-containing protein [Vallitalea guaymasensis]QUH30784.1 AraC family transcriptional regulator [Vallitalea guaymasensis]